MLFFVVLFTGYILLDRFSAVRHVITLGGVPWLAIVLLGYIVANSMGPIAFGIDYLFMFCGFLAAVSVCGAFSSAAPSTITATSAASSTRTIPSRST